MKPIVTSITIFMLVVLSACASLTPHFETPQVSVKSFTLLPGNSINPTFEIGLRVTNPNSIELNLKGMSYTASIEGNRIFSGVASQLPIIPAYAEDEVKLKAQADLFGGLRLMGDLLKPREKPITYSLKIKLDIGLFALPIYINHEGVLAQPKRL